MTQVFEIELTVGGEKFPLLFNSKVLAETFVSGLWNILTEKGKKAVTFKANEKTVFESEQDILKEITRFEMLNNMKGEA